MSPSALDARLTPRVVQQHQREQRVRLGRRGHQRDEQSPKPNRLARQVAPNERVSARRGVAFSKH